MEAVSDPRITEDICGIIDIRGLSEFICVRKPHAKVYTRNVSSGPHMRGDLIFNTNPQADRHYFVNRWPNRKRES